MNEDGQTIVTESGRGLRIIETGQTDGTPVLVQHGTPASRLLHESWVEDARSRGIRLIGYDRPGYGGSSPRPGRSVGDAAGDVAAIAGALGLERLAVWGLSGGGPHALACAALLPNLVVAAAAVASPAPYPAEGIDWFEGRSELGEAEFRAAVAGREALEGFVEATAQALLSADVETFVQVMRASMSPADQAAFTDEAARYLYAAGREGIRERRDGWIDDDLAFVSPWGFRMEQIEVPVLLVHGEQDRAVPFAHGEWLAGKIPGAESRFTADDGHVGPAFRVPEVHAWLLEKLA